MSTPRQIALSLNERLAAAGLAAEARQARRAGQLRARELRDAAARAEQIAKDKTPAIVADLASGDADPATAAARLAKSAGPAVVDELRTVLELAARRAEIDADRAVIDATPDALAEAAREVAELVDRNRDRAYIDGSDADRFAVLEAVARTARFYGLAPDREPVDRDVEQRLRQQAHKQAGERAAAEAEARRQAKFAEQEQRRAAARAARLTPAGRANAARLAERRQDDLDALHNADAASVLGP